MKLVFVIIMSALLLISCAKQLGKEATMKDIQLETDDEKKIVGTFYEGGSEGIILLHMMDRTRNDWRDFALKLQNLNYSVIAVDFRGHGESEGSWKDFSEEDFQAMDLDVEAAFRYLEQNNITNITIIGASIGANIALRYAVEHGIGKVVLLSPGLDFQGIDTEEPAKVFEGKILIAASKEDKYSFDSSREIYSLIKSNQKSLKIYENAGHGTKMLDNTDLSTVILDWLKA